MKYLKYPLFCLSLISVMNCAAQENKTSKKDTNIWQFIEASDLPPEISNSGEALITKYVVVPKPNSTDKKYIVLEGLEYGWYFSIWNDQKWVPLTPLEGVWLGDFQIGYFNSDENFDIILYPSLEEINITGEILPAMPRLFLGNGTSFQGVEVACNESLRSFFRSNLYAYTNGKNYKDPSSFLKSVVIKEQEKLSEPCRYTN